MGNRLKSWEMFLGFKNTLGTKRIKINPTHPHLPQKKLGMYIVSLHWLNIIYILAFVYCHFQPSLMARTYNWGTLVEGTIKTFLLLLQMECDKAN